MMQLASTPIRRLAPAMITALLLAGGLLPGVFACQSREPIEERRLPQLQPTPGLELPSTLSIPVLVDGVPAPPIDRAALGRIAPDFQDGERRAWRFDSVLGALAGRAATVAVSGEAGITIELHHDPASTTAVPVLIVTRRGEVQAALIDPKDPFPAYHETGGRRARPGDPWPRLAALGRIAVRLDPPQTPP